MNSIVNYKMTGDLLSNRQIIKIRGVVVVDYRRMVNVVPIRNSASRHEGYGGVEVPLRRFYPSALN